MGRSAIREEISTILPDSTLLHPGYVLGFVSFEVLPDVLSDHSAMVAGIRMQSSCEPAGAL